MRSGSGLHGHVLVAALEFFERISTGSDSFHGRCERMSVFPGQSS